MELLLSTPGLNITDVFSETLIQRNNDINEVVSEYTFLPQLDGLEYPFMNSDEDINKTVKQYSSHHRVQRFLRNIITPIICVLGFLGNIVNIIVLSKLQSQRRDETRDRGTHLGLIVLAVSDMLFCLSMFPRCLVPESSSLFDHKDFHWFYQVGLFYIYKCNVILHM